jgi:Predicted phosphoesterases, related to the Icc protein
MEIWTLSDLHLTLPEARSFEMPFEVPKADVCVVAGDVTDDLVSGLHWLAHNILPHMPVLTVLGNHEFFGHDIPSGRRKAAKIAAETGVHLLDNSSIEIGGIRFAGGTLWTDFRLFEDEDEHTPLTQRACMSEAKRRFADFDEIWATEASDMRMARLFSPRDAEQLHRETVSFLDRFMFDCDGVPSVIVTHHAPSAKSIHPRFDGMATSAAFASNMDGFISAFGLDLWVHGHVHDSFDYQIGRSRVMCNPRGYAASPNPDFQASMICTVPSRSLAHQIE